MDMIHIEVGSGIRDDIMFDSLGRDPKLYFGVPLYADGPDISGAYAPGPGAVSLLMDGSRPLMVIFGSRRSSG